MNDSQGLSLTFDEMRVLGVLIEKAQTVPGSYPMTINGVVTGCNQKSNRDPVVSFDEERVGYALEDLQKKGFTREVHESGSRVIKFRHVARDTLGIDTRGLVVLAELMLRGPQTVGELRQRAGRMHALESVELVENVLRSLIDREGGALVEEIPAAAGSRAKRYVQLLCVGAHPVGEVEGGSESPERTGVAGGIDSGGRGGDEIEALAERMESLERRLKALEDQLGM